eukprot:139884_1
MMMNFGFNVHETIDKMRNDGVDKAAIAAFKLVGVHSKVKKEVIVSKGIDLIQNIYNAVSQCFIFENISSLYDYWICYDCGNKNVKHFEASKMIEYVTNCTLCGITRIDSIVLKLRNRPAYIMVNDIDDNN